MHANSGTLHLADLAYRATERLANMEIRGMVWAITEQFLQDAVPT